MPGPPFTALNASKDTWADGEAKTSATLLASELRITIQVLAPMWISFIFGAVRRPDCFILPKHWSVGNRGATNPVSMRRSQLAMLPSWACADPP